ncbi:nicotinate phosphoribosyltransferase [Planktothrix sp. FACHB-1365]|uniref:nicotinate phosphoribosyltransferase n=1 Tax=Planktothrix sp. FACHB-1365 TaxID=2692855 RepID=UPI001685FDAB|nr:nicotinate phosphoribosyltransferase [Planktothrix sp. FACHB-1365]MBD2483020.1 nicotinate phosphoribosyltransferase [Planktothrix sp. FACHB-1365]
MSTALSPLKFQEVWEDPDLNFTPDDYSLLTDLYQLTMIACYTGEGLDQRQASFELFTRRLPEGFGYLIAMGLAQALDYLEQFRFSEAQLHSLQSTGLFTHAPQKFWSLLATGRFTGDVWAVSEGTAIFANQPFLRIEAPLWQAQLIETYLLNTINYQTLIATRAARLRDVAGPTATLLEFGTRRAFSPQASIWAARAALAGGLDATSNVLAALKLGQKPTGTMAHALVMAISALEGSETQAFTAFHRYFPGAPLLIDTYNTIDAARKLSEQVKRGEIELKGVRLDSGDLVSLSQQVRSLLPNIPIFASGDLDEYEIARLKAAGAMIDGYGLGTKLVTGTPVNGVYKLVEIEGKPVMKEATGKTTYPGRKQIFRTLKQGQLMADEIGLMTEPMESESWHYSNVQSIFSSRIPLMQLVMKQGKPLYPTESLTEIAERTAKSVASLPSETRCLNHPISPTIQISPALQELTKTTRH